MNMVSGNHIKPITKSEAASFNQEDHRKKEKQDRVYHDIGIINTVIKTEYDNILKGGYVPIRVARHSGLDELNELYNKEGFELYVDPISVHTCVKLLEE